MDKKTVEQFLSLLIKRGGVGRNLTKEETKVLVQILQMSQKYQNICDNSSDYKFKIDNYIIASGRRVRMIFAYLKQNPHLTLPIPKTKLLESIWPPKPKNKESTHLAEVKAAARLIIGPQIKQFRESVELPAKCPLTRKKLTNWSLIHIDHIEPFSILFSSWLDLNNLNPYDIALKGPKTAKVFADESLIKSWYEFHKTNASLQAVHKTANLKKGAKYEA